LHALLACLVIPDLAVDCNLNTIVSGIGVDVGLGVDDVLFINPFILWLGAHVIQSISVRSLRGQVGKVGRSTRDNVGSTRSAVGGAVGEGKGTTMYEGSTNRENDSERHSGGQNSCHARGSSFRKNEWMMEMLRIPSDNGSDGILKALCIPGIRTDDEPVQYICHVDDPDGLMIRYIQLEVRMSECEKAYAIEVKTVTKHQLPRGERLDTERLQRSVESEAQLWNIFIRRL
jgi:hypothetical protein